MPKILVKRKAEVFQEYLIPPDKDSITVGAESDNDLMIDDKKVSMNHLQLVNDGARFYIKDLRSAFGTFLNGEPVNEMTPVKHGDAIQIGQHSLIFLEDDTEPGNSNFDIADFDLPNIDLSDIDLPDIDLDSGELTADDFDLEQDLARTQQELENIQATSFNFDMDAYDHEATPSRENVAQHGFQTPVLGNRQNLAKANYYLLAIYGPNHGKKYQLNQTETRIGRDNKLNDIIIRHDAKGNVDPSISRRHATIRNINGTFFISDKRSKTRTFVNQYKLSETDEHQLFPGDEIEIVSDQQSSIFRFCPEDNLNFSPPKKAGVWWIRFRWPITRGISAILLIMAIILGVKALSKRSVMTQTPDAVTLNESVWLSNNQTEDGAQVETYYLADNFINTPVINDFNADEILDIAFLDPQGRIRAISGKTKLPIWETEAYIRAQMPGQLVTADVNGDRVDDIIMFSTTERLIVLDGRFGIEIWSSSIIGGRLAGVPCAADINGDGYLDVAASIQIGKFIVAFGGPTQPEWSIHEIGDSLRSSPSAIDITGDGIPEFLLGTESGLIYAFQGKTKKFLVKLDINEQIAEALGTMDQMNRIRTPVSMGFLNSDNRPDLIVSTDQGNLLTLNGLNNQQMWIDVSTPEGDFLSELFFPAMTGDFDGDGSDDVVIFTYDGRIRAFKGASKTGAPKIVLWEFVPSDWEKYIANPVLADINKDGIPDVFAAGVNHGLYVINGRNGQLLWKSEYGGNNPITTAPVIADLDNDSQLDVVLMRTDRQIYQYICNVRYPLNSVVWGQRFANAQNNCRAQLIPFSTGAYTLQIVFSLLLIIAVAAINYWGIRQQKNFTNNS